MLTRDSKRVMRGKEISGRGRVNERWSMRDLLMFCPEIRRSWTHCPSSPSQRSLQISPLYYRSEAGSRKIRWRSWKFCSFMTHNHREPNVTNFCWISWRSLSITVSSSNKRRAIFIIGVTQIGSKLALGRLLGAHPALLPLNRHRCAVIEKSAYHLAFRWLFDCDFCTVVRHCAWMISLMLTATLQKKLFCLIYNGNRNS